MRSHTNDRLKGTLDLLVLKILASRGRMHGFAITLWVEESSDNVLHLEEGSLYPALHRMTQAGWLRSEWGASENNRRARFYELTPRGRKQITVEISNWRRIVAAINRAIEPLKS